MGIIFRIVPAYDAVTPVGGQLLIVGDDKQGLALRLPFRKLPDLLHTAQVKAARRLVQ